jgi:hypothetical protein
VQLKVGIPWTQGQLQAKKMTGSRVCFTLAHCWDICSRSCCEKEAEIYVFTSTGEWPSCGTGTSCPPSDELDTSLVHFLGAEFLSHLDADFLVS